MNSNVKIYIDIITLANSIGNETIVREAIVGLGTIYGIAPANRVNSIKEIRLYTPVASANRITAIRELRDRASENGMALGLKEAKEEVDRRFAEAGLPLPSLANRPSW